VAKRGRDSEPQSGGARVGITDPRPLVNTKVLGAAFATSLAAVTALGVAAPTGAQAAAAAQYCRHGTWYPVDKGCSATRYYVSFSKNVGWGSKWVCEHAHNTSGYYTNPPSCNSVVDASVVSFPEYKHAALNVSWWPDVWNHDNTDWEHLCGSAYYSAHKTPHSDSCP
jgi:hypothetical protein